MSNKIQALRGMNDVLPDESPLWEFFEDTVREVFRRYGYRNIRTPIVERTMSFFGRRREKLKPVPPPDWCTSAMERSVS